MMLMQVLAWIANTVGWSRPSVEGRDELSVLASLPPDLAAICVRYLDTGWRVLQTKTFQEFVLSPNLWRLTSRGFECHNQGNPWTFGLWADGSTLPWHSVTTPKFVTHVIQAGAVLRERGISLDCVGEESPVVCWAFGGELVGVKYGSRLRIFVIKQHTHKSIWLNVGSKYPHPVLSPNKNTLLLLQEGPGELNVDGTAVEGSVLFLDTGEVRSVAYLEQFLAEHLEVEKVALYDWMLDDTAVWVACRLGAGRFAVVLLEGPGFDPGVSRASIEAFCPARAANELVKS